MAGGVYFTKFVAANTHIDRASLGRTGHEALVNKLHLEDYLDTDPPDWATRCIAQGFLLGRQVLTRAGPQLRRQAVGYRALNLLGAMKDWVPIIVAVVAAAAATFGYLFNSLIGRLSDRRVAYAKALQTAQRFNKLPHTFYRRTDDGLETLDRLAQLLADIQVELAFHRRWLDLDDAEVGTAFNHYIDKLDSTNSDNRRKALAHAPATTASDIEVPDNEFPFAARDARTTCINVMRRKLLLRNALLRFRRRRR